MSTFPPHDDPSRESSHGRPASEADPAVPRPLPRDDSRGARLGYAVMAVALVAIVLIVLL